MQDTPTIAELERRIAAALDRIGQGLAQIPDAAANGDALAPVEAEMTALQEALEVERTAAAQLAERLKAVKEREAAGRRELEALVAALTDARAQDEVELQSLRATVAELRESLTAQTEALQAGLSEPHPGDATLQAELEALREQRRVESAEMAAILSALTPLIEEPRAHA